MKREMTSFLVVLLGLIAGVALLTAPPDVVEAGGCWGMSGSTTTAHGCGWTPSVTYIQCSDSAGGHNHHHHHNKDIAQADSRCDRTGGSSSGGSTSGSSGALARSERVAWREVVLRVTGTTMGNPNTTSTTAAPTTATSSSTTSTTTTTTTTTSGSGSGSGSSGSGSGSGS